jgi:hypothetical protein
MHSLKCNLLVHRRVAQAQALTIRQPWAELILRGRKPWRSWEDELQGASRDSRRDESGFQGGEAIGPKSEKLTTGSFVGVAIFSDVRPYSPADARLLRRRRAGGGWYPNLFSWVLKKPRRVAPISASLGCSINPELVPPADNSRTIEERGIERRCP